MTDWPANCLFVFPNATLYTCLSSCFSLCFSCLWLYQIFEACLQYNIHYINFSPFPLSPKRMKFLIARVALSMSFYLSVNVCCRFDMSCEYKQEFLALNPRTCLCISNTNIITLSSSDVVHFCSPVACAHTSSLALTRPVLVSACQSAHHVEGLRGGEVRPECRRWRWVSE